MAQTLQHITVEELQEQFAQGRECQVVDVRELAEYEAEHIAGSRVVPLSTFTQQADRIDRNQTVYVVCRSGARATQAAERLHQLGHPDVRILEGGLQAWIAAGHVLERGARRVWSLERQVRFVAGSLGFLSALMAWLVHPGFLALAACVGAGLIFAAVTDTCGMAMVLARMPWNQRSQNTAGATCPRAM